MQSLYEINSEIHDLIYGYYEALEDGDGVIPEDLQKGLDELAIKRENKIGNYCKFIKNCNAEVKMLKDEIDNLTKRKKVVENKSKFIKSMLESNMSIGELYSDSNSKISWRKSESVNIIDESSIPEDYTETEIKIKKSDIKKAIKAGHIISGAEIKINQNIQIK